MPAFLFPIGGSAYSSSIFYNECAHVRSHIASVAKRRKIKLHEKVGGKFLLVALFGVGKERNLL